ncbi:MAG: DUF507 family protein [Nitrospinae bacterium]|nr:DUF507 family protein [Nitrospinota bacterium]
MAALFSEEKHSHLSHIILQYLQKSPQARIVGDPTLALREIKRILNSHIVLEQEIDTTIRNRLASYSRRIPEGSPEWDVLYQKIYGEELRKRKLG